MSSNQFYKESGPCQGSQGSLLKTGQVSVMQREVSVSGPDKPRAAIRRSDCSEQRQGRQKR